jgi:hypothetical protein
MNATKEKLRKGDVVYGQIVLEFVPGIAPMLASPARAVP